MEISISAEKINRKETFYTLRDYFYRIWYKVRSESIDKSDIYCMAELAAILFDRKEIEKRYKNYRNTDDTNRFVYEKGLELKDNVKFMKNLNILLKESKRDVGKEVEELINKVSDCYKKNDWKKLIKIAEKMLQYSDFKAEAYFHLGNGFHNIDEDIKAVEYYQNSLKIDSDNSSTWYNMGISYFYMKDYLNYYKSFAEYIRFAPEFRKSDFFKIDSLKAAAQSVFKSPMELQKLLDNKSILENRIESIVRLLLLGKFVAVTDSLDMILKENSIPDHEIKKMEFYFQAYLLDILTKEQSNSEIKSIIKYWVLIISRSNEISVIKEKFLKFIYNYIASVNKKNISMEFFNELIRQLNKRDIPVSEIIFTIIEAIKNPNTRESQKWMADPLFAEIIKQLSDSKDVD